ncbi:hypothetical protein N7507_001007 [Penicillium longicatenatum]|nr:hypothetical protein N7507_001007 [Penicillium longicatenatum]
MATHHTTFRESLGGQKVTIPNVYEILPEWKPRTHKEYKRAKEDVLDPWIEKWVDDKRTAQKLKAADFGLFAAVWTTDASFDVLYSMADTIISKSKYFVYDDIFDCGSLKYDTGIVGAYREASLQYFKYSLNGDGEAPDLSMFDMELQKGLQCWDEIGLHIHRVCSKETREILCDEMLRYVGSLNNVDSIFENSHIPSIQHYWDRREATAAVYCVIATIPFIYGLDITRDDVNDRPMKDLWRHASYIVHMRDRTNDMFSMRKKIGDNQIENLVPVLMLNRSIDCNTAMSQSYEFAVNEAMGLRDAEKRLLTKCENGSKAIITQAFIQGCQDVAMGLVHWRYSRIPWQFESRANFLLAVIAGIDI